MLRPPWPQGGTNPAFWAINADSQYDSWLTVGVTQGNVHNDVSSIGIDWETWTLDSELTVDNGAVFWMDPDLATDQNNPEIARTVLGQLTIPTGVPATALINAQGRSFEEHEDWEEIGMEIHFFGGRRPEVLPDGRPELPRSPPPPIHRVIACPAVAPIPNGQIRPSFKDGHDGKSSRSSLLPLCLQSQRSTARSDHPAMRS